MPNAPIQGNNCLFQVDMGNGYKDVLCAKSFSIVFNTEEKEVTAPEDGYYKDFDYKSLSYTMNLNGVLQVPDEINPTVFDLLYYQQNFLEVVFRLAYQESEELVRLIYGRCIIKDVNLLATAGQLADGTVNMIGKGAWEVQEAFPDPQVLHITTSMVNPDLENQKFKVKLLDESMNVVFTSETLDEASSGWLIAPFNITTSVESGMYYVQFTSEVTAFGNVASVTMPVTWYVRPFSTGTYISPDLIDFTGEREITFAMGDAPPPPPCVDVAIAGVPDLPEGTEGEPYNYIFSLTGSAPFAVSDVTKPSWMVITIDQDNKWIILSGTPDAAATGEEVSFDITNCSAGSVSFIDTVDIAAAPIEVRTIGWTFEDAGGAKLFRIYVDGVLTVDEFGVNASGTFNSYPGSSVQSSITGSFITAKQLIVSNNIDGEMHNSTGSGTQTYTFTIEDGKDYTILGT